MNRKRLRSLCLLRTEICLIPKVSHLPTQLSQVQLLIARGCNSEHLVEVWIYFKQCSVGAVITGRYSL